MADIPTKSRDKELQKLASKVTVLVLSEEFKALRKELEQIYVESDVEKPQVRSFEDALYSLLLQKEDVELYKIKAF